MEREKMPMQRYTDISEDEAGQEREGELPACAKHSIRG